MAWAGRFHTAATGEGVFRSSPSRAVWPGWCRRGQRRSDYRSRPMWGLRLRRGPF